MAESKSITDRTVLVTGGHGFIGRHVVTALARAGAQPISTVHPTGRLVPGLPGMTLSVDLEDPDQAMESVSGADMVIHLAARAGGIQFQRGGDEEVGRVRQVGAQLADDGLGDRPVVAGNECGAEGGHDVRCVRSGAGAISF